MGNFIKIAGVNPPSNRPRVDLPDALLPDAGALFLIDPAHPYEPWAAGVPGHATAVPNIAGDQASALINSTDVAGAYVNSVPGDLTVERTSKGGLHVIPKLGVSTNRHVRVMLAGTGFSQYVYDNWQHSYYFSMWTCISRIQSGTGTPPFIGAIAEGSNGYLADHYQGMGNYPQQSGDHSETWIGSSSGNPYSAGVPHHRYIGVSGYMRNTTIDGVSGYRPQQPSSATAVAFQAYGGGRTTWPVGNSFTDPGATILYRSYLEDLTVSGRSYAEVQALDAALFNREVMTEGGRYYGDTYTAPPTA